MNVVPLQNPPEKAGAKCPSCGASVVADQRYCLTCGQPCAPTRLAFLDVLHAESDARAPVTIAPAPGYLPPLQQDGAIGWLRRYSGLFALLSVLLLTGIAGLLIGHWLTSSKATPATQVLKIEGGLPAVAAAPGASTTPSPTSSSAATTAAKKSANSSAADEAQEKKEVKEAESPKAKQPAPVKTSSSKLKEIDKLSGKKHQQAVNKLIESGAPIETGG